MQREAIEAVSKMNFKEFDIQKFKDRKNIKMILVGKTHTGKTHLLEWLLYNIKGWYHTVYVFCETLEVQPNEFNFAYPNNKFSKFDESVLQNIWDTQKTYIMDNVKNGVDKKTLNHVAIIFDDVIANPVCRNSEIYDRLYIQGRHLNFACFSLTQTISTRSGFPSLHLQNVDVLISFQLRQWYCKESLCEKFLSNNNMKEGHEILKRLTNQNYQAIVIDNTTTSPNYEDYVYTITAPEKIPKFKIGHPTSIQITHVPKPRKNKKNKTVVPPPMTYNITVKDRNIYSPYNVPY